MAEAERRPGKTPLLKQPEIEEMDEEHRPADEPPYANNKDSAHHIHNNSSRNSEDGDANPTDHGTYSIPVTPNGSALTMSMSFDSPDDLTSPMTTSATMTQPQHDVHTAPDSSPRPERALKVNHSFSKAKQLIRSTAIDDSLPTPVLPEVKVTTTPAPDNDDVTYEYTPPIPLLGQEGSIGRTLQKNGSLSSDAGTSNCSLSRESSVEKNFYKDSSGVDLEEFIKKTLAKSKKDKQMLLNLEKDFRIFVDSQDQHYQLAEMCSYDRMICHRVAAFYGLDHNIDKSGKCVIVSKTKFTRIPTFNCEEYVKTMEPSDEYGGERKPMKLLKKPASMEERISRGGDKTQFSSHRTKSLEERQKHYDEKRKIIFGASSEEAQGYSVIEPVSSPGGCKRLSSKDWSSTDSSGYVSEDGSRLRRGMMAKANSYGGKPTIHLSPNTRTCSLSKADSITSGSYESAPVRTKQTSPENSQSPISGSRSSSADVNSPSQGCAGGGSGPPYPVLVATDINTIPPGSLVVNPHTLQPHVNADGTPYRYDPNDPTGVPPWLMNSMSVTTPSHPQPSAAQPISFNPSSVQPVQYTQNNDLCNRFSSMELTTHVEAPMDSQQMVAVSHQPPQPQHHPVPQQHLQQQPSQLPLMVSTAMQPAQQFVTSYTGATQGPSFYTGAQLQFVPVDAQGQCLSITGPSTASMQPSMVNYGQPQLVQTASAIQPGMLDQSAMTPGSLYGQTMYTGTVTDTGGNPNGYCVPYMSGGIVYPSSHYPPSGATGMAVTPAGGAHYGPYNAPQQPSSPQLACGSFAPMAGAQVRPATPPSLPMAQPVGYHSGQAGMGLSHGVTTPPHFQHGTYYAAQPHPFPPTQQLGQVMQVSVRPQGGGGGMPGGGGHSHPHPHPQPMQGGHQHQGGHHPTPTLQHSQSFPLLRTVPTSGPSSLALGPAPGSATTPPQHHPMMSVKSMSMGSMPPTGGAATPDKENTSLGLGGPTTFLPSVNQATAVQFTGQFMAQGMRQPQPGDLRVMGTSIRPQITPSLIAFQPGQPVRNRPMAPRQSRPPKRNHSNAGSTNHCPTTTASASVARVMSLDSGSALHHSSRP